jgi:hypothetical protein
VAAGFGFCAKMVVNVSKKTTVNTGFTIVSIISDYNIKTNVSNN